MKPIPETVQAARELNALLDDGRLLQQLIVKGHQVREIVPDCVGMSITFLTEGITLTLVATTSEIAVLDAIQYLDGGPCVDAVENEVVLEVNEPHVLDEPAWQLFSQATAAAGIKNTLTLPILAGERVTGSVNLYAASANAFTGHHQELAEVFDAWAPGAVTNADLAFATRSAAQAAPQVLRDQATIETAVGYLMAAKNLDAAHAYQQLEDAASRAAVSVLELAKTILTLSRRQDSA